MPTYQLISALTITNTSTSFFEFTNIPQTYSDLVIHAVVRNAGGNYGGMSILPNNMSDTGGVFVSLTTIGVSSRGDLLDVWNVQMTQDTVGRFSLGYLTINGYTKTATNKVGFAASGRYASGAFRMATAVRFGTDTYTASAQVTSIKIGYPTLDYINSSSVCSLYGISNA